MPGRDSQESGRGKKKNSEEELWKTLPMLKGEERIEALNFLGRKAFEREDFASAAIFSEEAASTWLKEKSSLNAVMAFLNASVSWYRRSDLDSSLNAALSAKELLDGVVIQDGKGQFREILGQRFTDLSFFDEALEQFELAVSSFEASSESHRVAHVMHQMSIIYLKKNNLSCAIAFIDNSLHQVHEKDFRRCCVHIVLQWADLSIRCGLLERIPDVVNDAIDSAEALGEKDGLAELRLRLAIYNNKVRDSENSLVVLRHIEKSRLMRMNRIFQAKVFLEKARALSIVKQPQDAEKTLHKARSVAKSISDILLVREIDDFELRMIMQVGQPDQARGLISKLRNSEWYKLHPEANQNLKIWDAQILYQARQHRDCLQVIDELLLMSLSHSQLLLVMALRAHIVFDSNNGNLARVLVGKSKEIAESSHLEFPKLLFSIWYQVLEICSYEEAKNASAELVQIFLAEDIKALSEKSVKLTISAMEKNK